MTQNRSIEGTGLGMTITRDSTRRFIFPVRESAVSLEIAVQLGKTCKTVKEILDFEEGTLIELDRLAGEMMDILVNGKVLAKGEIVVLEDKFAVQLKEINT